MSVQETCKYGKDVKLILDSTQDSGGRAIRGQAPFSLMHQGRPNPK